MQRGILRRHKLVLVLLVSALILPAAGCRAQLTNPPRLATAEAAENARSAATAEPLYLPAPTATGAANLQGAVNSDGSPTINVWINETSQQHRDVLDDMASDFRERSGIEVALQFVDPALLPDLTQTAVLSDTLPDLILHPLEYTVSWSENGILDAAASDTVVRSLGRETFDAGALDLVTVDGLVAAVPSDGYQQLLLYRADWFAENELDRPDNYEDMLDAAEALFNPDELVYGLVIPTESNLRTTHRAFEHLAIANGCQLIHENGQVLLLEEACREALDFYFAIVNQFSPPGVQTDTSARNAYLDGRTAMMMGGPSILADLVRANRLDQRTGIVTELAGYNPDEEAANFGNVAYLGITTAADRDAAEAFARYWFNEGYQKWLAVESERKVPMRLGTADRPRFYIDAWGTAPILQGESLTDIFGPQIVGQLRDGVGATERWGFSEEQGGIVGQLYSDLTLSIVLQEMLSGYFNSAKTIFEAYERVIELIPDYAYPIVPTPEA